MSFYIYDARQLHGKGNCQEQQGVINCIHDKGETLMSLKDHNSL